MATIPKNTSVKDVDPSAFVQAFAQHLKRSGKMVVPAYCDHIKTSCAKQLGPADPDWFYVRAAAVARHLYVRPAGTNGLRKAFGCSKRKNMLRAHHSIASGGVIRYILKEFEKMEIVDKAQSGGRKLTPNGLRMCDRVANQLKTVRFL